jgi:hypothetical protein
VSYLIIDKRLVQEIKIPGVWPKVDANGWSKRRLCRYTYRLTPLSYSAIGVIALVGSAIGYGRSSRSLFSKVVLIILPAGGIATAVAVRWHRDREEPAPPAWEQVRSELQKRGVSVVCEKPQPRLSTGAEQQAAALLNERRRFWLKQCEPSGDTRHLLTWPKEDFLLTYQRLLVRAGWVEQQLRQNRWYDGLAVLLKQVLMLEEILYTEAPVTRRHLEARLDAVIPKIPTRGEQAPPQGGRVPPPTDPVPLPNFWSWERLREGLDSVLKQSWARMLHD